jgi:hypothetical protein
MADGLRGDPIFIHPDCTGARTRVNEDLFLDHRLYAAIGDGLLSFGYAASHVRFSAVGRTQQRLHEWRWHAVDTARRALYRTRVRLVLRSHIANSLRSLRIRPAGR